MGNQQFIPLTQHIQVKGNHITHTGAEGVPATVRSVAGLPALQPPFHGLLYFEIEILPPRRNPNAPRRQDLPIGFAASFPDNQPWVVPGTEDRLGFTGDGFVHLGGSKVRERLSPPWNFNDVIGCGVDIDRKTLFWSRNGALIGSRSVDVLVRPFFALVGLKSPAAEVRIQLQQTKFVFNLNDYVMSQVGDAPVPAVLPGLNMQQQQQQQQSWKQDIQEPDSQEFVGEGKVTEDPQDDESLDYTGKDRIEYQKYTFLPEVGEDLILGDAEDEFAVRWGEHRASSTQIALIQSHVPLQPLHPDGRIDESGRRRRLYFEVELDRTESKLQDDAPSFAVGWSNRSLLRSEEPVTQLPGAQAGTWALHGTGMKFGEGVGSDYTHTLVGPLVLGCGLDLDSRQAFFTLNGTHLGTAFRGMGSPVSSNRDEGEDEEKGDENAEEEWWAIIGLRMSPCRASVRLVPPFSYMGAFEILSSVAEGDGGDANELELVRPLQLQRTVSSENRELRTQLEQLEDEKTCVVCCAEARDAVFLPCAHLVSCITCAVTVKECPMCRKEVTSHLRVFSS